jgi:thioredoxin reductase (NADPH)
MSLLDCAIIGAGPAGLTAATYLRRYHRSVLVFDGGESRARWIPRTHNCPGYPNGISGNDLLKRLREQALAHEVAFEATRVRCVRPHPQGFRIEDGERHWLARTLLLATGINDLVPEMDDVEGAIASATIRLCAICDAYEATDGDIGVLAPLQRGLEHAIFLRGYSASVSLVPVSAAEAAAADAGLLKRAQEHQIRITPPCAGLSATDHQCVVKHEDGSESTFDTVYPVLGALPESSLAADLGVHLSDNGEIDVDAHNESSLKNVFAAGDVVSELNQIAVAMGHAAIAATAIHRRLPRNPRQARTAHPTLTSPAQS